MEVAGFNEFGLIVVILDEQTLFVPDDMSNRHRREIAEWEALGNVIPPYVPPEEIPAEVEVQFYAAAYDLEILEGEITSVTAVDSSIMGIAWVAPGLYEVYLVDYFENLDYYPKVYDHDMSMRVIEKYPDYFVVESTDSNGNSADPEKFNVEITAIR
jgi:hypothetical protein